MTRDIAHGTYNHLLALSPTFPLVLWPLHTAVVIPSEFAETPHPTILNASQNDPAWHSQTSSPGAKAELHNSRSREYSSDATTLPQYREEPVRHDEYAWQTHVVTGVLSARRPSPPPSQTPSHD